jgi:hypothetical protein
MATVTQLEAKIFRIEGFKVRLRHPDGRDVRGDARIADRYQFERALRNNANVRSWIDGRFRVLYHEYEIDVLRADGTKAHGNHRLATVRDTYLD